MSGKKSHKAKHKKEKKVTKVKTAKVKSAKAKSAKAAAPRSRPADRTAAKTAVKPALKVVGKPTPGKPTAPIPAAAKGAPAKGALAKAGAAAPGGLAVPGRPTPPFKPSSRPAKKGSRRSSLSQRRGPDGELLAPGDLLLPGGAQRSEEIQYLFRGGVAAEHPVIEEGIQEIIAKRGANPDAAADRPELGKNAEAMRQRFEVGVEPLLPTRPPIRRTFQGVVERARHRRREIGAFLRGLDLGHTEMSHMDSHGEASLESLMVWAANLEKLLEADEPERVDYNQFHRVLDQIENTTEALIIDIEQTLRRLRDRTRNG
jgi:hypothetical protein